MSATSTPCRDALPADHFPAGWYWVAQSDRLEPGTSRPVRLFGRELVLFRGASGRATLMAAHCPHLGAHMGHGGRVEGDEMVCPFHGWRFGGDGALCRIPYSEKRPRITQRIWAIREVAGQILAWNHPQAEEPAWEPDLHGAGLPRGATLRLHRRWTLGGVPDLGGSLPLDGPDRGIVVTRADGSNAGDPYVIFAVPRDAGDVEFVGFLARTGRSWPGTTWMRLLQTRAPALPYGRWAGRLHPGSVRSPAEAVAK